MFKLVVLSALVALAVAKPGILHGGVAIASPALAYTAPAVVVAPSAVSHQSRVDYISKPVVAAYAAPVVAAPHVVEYSAPVITAAIPAAVSHTHRVDIHSKPVLAAYTSHAVIDAPVAAVHAW